MIRTMSRFATLSAALVLVGQASCSSATSSGGSATAGTSGSASSAGSSASGANGAGAPGTAGAGTSGASSGGASGTTSESGTGGVSGGSNGGASNAGNAGMSAGGTAGTGGNSGGNGLGGTTNSYGTIVGSPAVTKLLELTKTCTDANKIAGDTGKFQTDAGKTVHVCALKGGTGNTGGAIFYTADMDIDCDGLTTDHCPGSGDDEDPSYYYQTAFTGPHSKAGTKGGPALAAENTPYVVIPEEIKAVDQNNGGNIVAVIYKNQIEFAVFGDTIAYQADDDGEPIGESSVRTAVGLGIPSSPATGGVAGGVTYIAFTGPGTQPKDMEDIAEIQALGMKLLQSLLQNNP